MKGLIIKKKWLDLILDGRKTWEIRGCNTHIRGKIELIQSGSGFVVGSCELVESKVLTVKEYQNSFDKHQINDTNELPYKSTFAWSITNTHRYELPRPYKHPKGAIIWVNL